jgi:hypothetical protein
MTAARSRTLTRFGYTDRQAMFLSAVAAHSGYFLRRQFMEFIGRGHGAVTVTFLRAVLMRGHAVVARLRNHSQVYHLVHKSIYATLGNPNSRNRRRHELSAIRLRLMRLDFVLTRREWTFFGNERDVVQFFTECQRISHDLLPAAVWTGRTHGHGVTTRYFAERYPIGISPDGQAVVLVYVDDADTTEAGFTRFLERYVPLCRRLTMPVEVVFLTAAEGQESIAERAFSRVTQRHPAHANENLDGDKTELREYVRARRMWEEKALAGVRQEQLDAMRSRLQQFRHPLADALYRTWQLNGDSAIDRFLAERSTTVAVDRVRLVVHRLPFDYGAFGAWKTEGC